MKPVLRGIFGSLALFFDCCGVPMSTPLTLDSPIAFIGAMLGGLLLGLIEALGSGYVGNLTNGVFGSHYQDVFSFIVLVVVLIFRPSGLLGERSGDRA